MATPGRTALIVGAGIGGLAAGLALRKRGWSVRVFERARHPRELGFALALAPNAMAALDELGLAETVATRGARPTRAEIRRTDGRVLRQIVGTGDRAMAGAPLVVVLRPALHGALLDAVGLETIALGQEAIGFEIDGSRVTLSLAGGERVMGDVLVGADGVGSVIRRQLHPDEPPPRPSGYWAVRGVAPGVARHLGDLSAVGYFGDGLEIGVTRAGHDAIYWYVSLLARDAPADAPDARAFVRRCTAGVDARFAALVDDTPPGDLRVDELVERDPLADWGRGPVTVLGDAAHPMLPHTGQGAAQAMEDAVALGLALGGPGDLAEALRRYEHVRSARTRRFVRLGRRIARVTTTRSRLVAAVRTLAVRATPLRLLTRPIRRAGRDPHRELR